jgi:hypothetical protein
LVPCSKEALSTVKLTVTLFPLAEGRKPLATRMSPEETTNNCPVGATPPEPATWTVTRTGAVGDVEIALAEAVVVEATVPSLTINGTL